MPKYALKHSAKYLISIIPALLLGLLFSACPSTEYRYSEVEAAPKASLTKIKKKGELTAITEYSPTTYFIFKGQPMGFHYEMLKKFANHLGVRLNVKVSKDFTEIFSALSEQEVDLIAMDLTVLRDKFSTLEFIHPHGQTRQVLVQRRANAWRDAEEKVTAPFIRNPLDLAGKVVYVQKQSSSITRLRNLAEEIGDTIKVIEHPTDHVEDLIRKVANGEIDYTVCDENVALVNQTWYPELDVKTAISFPQRLAWAVNKGSDSLHTVLDKWMAEFIKSKDYQALRIKYFRNKKILSIAEMEFATTKRGVISPYDEYIRKHSAIVGWDWRLIASLIYQESRFHPEVRGWSGSFGLMQLMPATAVLMGIDTTAGPEEQIMAGAKYLRRLDRLFREPIPDPQERTKFILAAYNVGSAHVLDARRLAEKHGKDQNVWFHNVDTFLLLKAQPEYYNDPVVRYGYCRGDVTVRFVDEILHRYKLYKDVIRE